MNPDLRDFNIISNGLDHMQVLFMHIYVFVEDPMRRGRRRLFSTAGTQLMSEQPNLVP